MPVLAVYTVSIQFSSLYVLGKIINPCTCSRRDVMCIGEAAKVRLVGEQEVGDCLLPPNY